MKTKILFCIQILSLLIIILSINTFKVIAHWNEVARLPFVLASHQSLNVNNNLIVIAGAGEWLPQLNNIYGYPILAGGNLGDIQYSYNRFTNFLIWHSLVNKDNNVYVLGGSKEDSPGANEPVNSVYLGRFTADGSSVAWSELNSLPKKITLGGAAIIGNNIYYLGGNEKGYNWVSRNVVYSSNIESGGDIGSWSEENTNAPLPQYLAGFGVVTYAGKIIVVGGKNHTSGNISNKIYISNIDNQGKIVGWIPGPDLPIPLHRPAVGIVGNNIVIVGGETIGYNSDRIFILKINGSVKLNNWVEGINRLPENNCCNSLTIAGDYAFLSGGYAFSGYSNKILGIKISDLIDTGLSSPIIIIPGMLASWNYEAMIHNRDIPNSEWRLLPKLNLYNGLLNAIEGNGYEMGKDLFVYNYDWRKKIAVNGASFCDFANQISDSHGNQKIKVVGHSMGGLIARACMQSLQGGVIDQLITVGSPHQGATQAYLAWEGGEFPKFFPGMDVMLGLTTRVLRRDYNNRVQVLRAAAPSVQDLLPTFNYLKKDGKEISVTKMKWSNNYIPTLTSGLSNILTKTSTVTGTDMDTQRYYWIKNRTILDKINGRWEDGRPFKTEYASGDETVLAASGQIDGTLENILLPGLDHKNIVGSAVSQNKILEKLGLSALGQDTELIDWKKLIVVTVGSPVDFWVIDPTNGIIEPEDNLVIIPNAADGNYRVKLKSDDSNPYTIYVGRVLESQQVWEEYSGRFGPGGGEIFWDFKVDFSQPELGVKGLDTAIFRLDKIITLIKGTNLGTVRKTSLITQAEATKLIIRQLIASKESFLDKAKSIGYITGALEITDKLLKNSPTPEIAGEIRLVRDVLEEQAINLGG